MMRNRYDPRERHSSAFLPAVTPPPTHRRALTFAYLHLAHMYRSVWLRGPFHVLKGRMTTSVLFFFLQLLFWLRHTLVSALWSANVAAVCSFVWFFSPCQAWEHQTCTVMLQLCLLRHRVLSPPGVVRWLLASSAAGRIEEGEEKLCHSAKMLLKNHETRRRHTVFCSLWLSRPTCFHEEGEWCIIWPVLILKQHLEPTAPFFCFQGKRVKIAPK